MSREFNSQATANTLCAFATMGRQPGERMMRQQLEREVQFAGFCKHAVGVCENRGKAGGADDEEAGAAGGGDMSGIHLAATSSDASCIHLNRPLDRHVDINVRVRHLDLVCSDAQYPRNAQYPRKEQHLHCSML